MYKMLIILTVLLAGCIGSPEPTHPFRDNRSVVKPWWAASTADVPDDLNPWLKFVPAPEFDEFEALSSYDVRPWPSSAAELRSDSVIVAPRMYFLRLRAKEQAEKRKVQKSKNSRAY